MLNSILEIMLGSLHAEVFVNVSGALLMEAAEKQRNPIDGQSVYVHLDDHCRLAIAGLLMEFGLLRRTGTRNFVITEVGLAAVERLERHRVG
jgi:hypothetical protein